MILHSDFVDYKDEVTSIQVSVRQFFCTLFLLVPVLAQSVPLLRFQIDGLEKLTQDQVIALSGLHAGQSVTREQVREAAKQLMDSGKFQRVDYRVQPETDGIVVQFRLIEQASLETAAEDTTGPRIAHVVFRGSRVVEPARLQQIVESAAEDRTWKESDFRELLDNLLKPVYAEAGYWRVKWTNLSTQEAAADAKQNSSQGSALSTAQVTVTVTVDEDQPSKLAQVNLEGGDPKWVEAAAFPIGQVAEQKKINEAIGRLHAVVRRQGYLTPAFQQTVRLREDELTLILQLDKGPLAHFGTLKLLGLSADAEKRARALWTITPGSELNPEAVERFIHSVIDQHIGQVTGARREFHIRPGTEIADVEIAFR